MQAAAAAEERWAAAVKAGARPLQPARLNRRCRPSHSLASPQRPERRASGLSATPFKAPRRPVLHPTAAAPTMAPATTADAPARAQMRDQRLELLVQLRKLYRNLLRAETLLQQPTPVYQAPEQSEAASSSSSNSTRDASSGAGGADDQQGDGASTSSLTAAAVEEEEQQRIAEAVDVVAELQLTAEELKAGIRALRAAPMRWGSMFDPSAGTPEEVETTITSRVREFCQALLARAAEELPLLPFPSEAAAQAALDARNARYRLAARLDTSAWTQAEHWNSGEEGEPGVYPELVATRLGLGERLEAAERVAEAFVARKLQPAVAKVRETSPQGVVQGIKSSALWARDLWTRLNGGGQGGVSAAPQGLPLPTGSEEARKKRIAALNMEIEALEGRLQEASKTRESRLRKAGIQGRARVAAELRGMDFDVAALSKALAVRTLELEMEYIFACLEEEALDIVGDAKGDKKLALNRRGSSDEVALLIAEFRQLDEQLSALSTAAEAAAAAADSSISSVEFGEGEAMAAAAAVAAASASSSHSSSSSSSGAYMSDADAGLVERGAAYIDESELARLALEIPDLRVRLGVADTQVFGGTGWSFVKLRMQVQEGVTKVVDGVMFGVRGVRLLFTDIGNAGRLFWRAVSGGTLKPREVQALRRTVRDLLTFVPFAIILIIPMTPVGHVLVFSFLQRYFPGFFPSQFTGRRQELMIKYEQLKAQLKMAQMQLEAENDEMEFQKAAAAAAKALQRNDQKAAAKAVDSAAAAVATAGAGAGTVSSSSSGSGGAAAAALQQAGFETEEEEGPAARAVRRIEQQLAVAADDSYCEDSGSDVSAGE